MSYSLHKSILFRRVSRHCSLLRFSSLILDWNQNPSESEGILQFKSLVLIRRSRRNLRWEYRKLNCGSRRNLTIRQTIVWTYRRKWKDWASRRIVRRIDWTTANMRRHRMPLSISGVYWRIRPYSNWRTTGSYRMCRKSWAS
jgi:hypothetical protein